MLKRIACLLQLLNKHITIGITEYKAINGHMSLQGPYNSRGITQPQCSTGVFKSLDFYPGLLHGIQAGKAVA